MRRIAAKILGSFQSCRSLVSPPSQHLKGCSEAPSIKPSLVDIKKSTNILTSFITASNASNQKSLHDCQNLSFHKKYLCEHAKGPPWHFGKLSFSQLPALSPHSIERPCLGHSRNFSLYASRYTFFSTLVPTNTLFAGLNLHVSRLHQRRWASNNTTPPASNIPTSHAYPSFWMYINILGRRIGKLALKSPRPWTADEVLAMLSWVLLGISLFLLVGTTTFVSVCLWIANSLNMQDAVANIVGWYLTKITGATVIFESAIVPNWKDGKISLSNVFVRRTLTADESQLSPHYYYYSDNDMPSSEHDTDFANAPRLASRTHHNEFGDSHESGSSTYPLQSRPMLPISPPENDRDARNFTKYDIKIKNIEVTLDLIRWLDGKGLIKDATLKGVRGIIDRRDVFWDESTPAMPRRTAQPGDFDLERVLLEDLFVTVYNPQFRPYSVSIFNADLPQLRKQWLLYDIICASSLAGLFDNCLFSVHSPQQATAKATASRPDDSLLVTVIDDDEDMILSAPRRMTRLKIDGVPIDHLNYGTEGPFGWINGGTVDVTALIHIPQRFVPNSIQPDDVIVQLMDELRIVALEKIKVDVATGQVSEEWRQKAASHLAQVLGDEERRKESFSSALKSLPAPKTLHMDLELRFNNIRASVPLYSEGLSYMTTNALIRPLVAYMNAHRTAIPINCHLAMPLSDFDGAWTIYNAGLADALANVVGRAMIKSFMDDAERARRIRRVSLWSASNLSRSLADLWRSISTSSRSMA